MRAKKAYFSAPQKKKKRAASRRHTSFAESIHQIHAITLNQSRQIQINLPVIIIVQLAGARSEGNQLLEEEEQQQRRNKQQQI